MNRRRWLVGVGLILLVVVALLFPRAFGYTAGAAFGVVVFAVLPLALIAFVARWFWRQWTGNRSVERR